MSRDPRYGSAAWQRLRRAVLERDGHTCRIQGPRCRGVATTVHHLEPSSQRPDLFFAATNLVAACTACNYGDGARAKAANDRRRLEQLQEIIFQQDQKIQELLERLSQYEARPTRPNPAIY